MRSSRSRSPAAATSRSPPGLGHPCGATSARRPTRTPAERLRDSGRAGRFVAELSDFFQAFHERSYGFDGSPIHDAMAVAHVIDPTLLRTRSANVAVETRSDYCDGRTVADLRGVTGREPNAEVGVDVDAERFLELLVSRIASLP